MRKWLSTLAFVSHGAVGYASIILLAFGYLTYVGELFLLYSLTSIFVAYFTFVTTMESTSAVRTLADKLEKLIEERKALDPTNYNLYLLHSDIPARLRRISSINNMRILILILVFGVMLEIPFLNLLIVLYYLARSSNLLAEATKAARDLGLLSVTSKEVGLQLALGFITMGASLPTVTLYLSNLASAVMSAPLPPPPSQGSDQGSPALGGTP